MRHDWPGNVRELENVVERAVVLAAEPSVPVDVLPEALLQANGIRVSRGEGAPLTADASLFEIVNDYERRIIIERLEQCSWSQTEAAESLHVPLSTLNQKIKRLDIKIREESQRWAREPLLRAPAAVDQDVGAGDEGGIVRAQVDGELADLFDAAPAAQRDAAEELGGGFGVVQQGAIHFRREGAGADAVAGDSLRRRVPGPSPSSSPAARPCWRNRRRGAGSETWLIVDVILMMRP